MNYDMLGLEIHVDETIDTHLLSGSLDKLYNSDVSDVPAVFWLSVCFAGLGCCVRTGRARRIIETIFERSEIENGRTLAGTSMRWQCEKCRINVQDGKTFDGSDEHATANRVGTRKIKRITSRVTI